MLSKGSCEQGAMGIADGFIYLTASSEQNGNTPAKNARLNYTAGSSWCASTSDRNPYLQVDLQALHIICAVSTQGNSQGDQWVKTYTLQSSTDGTTWTDYAEGGQTKSFIGNYNRNSAVKHILYKGIVARYVRFVVGGSHNGACLRAEIFGVTRSKGNIALFKPTVQSSTFGILSVSSNAVNGERNTQDYRRCTHTETSTDPWWRLDMAREEPVAEVRILNRGDCCADRLDGAEIRVGNSTATGGAGNHLCADNIQVASGKEKRFFCKPITYGRYVIIRIPGNSKVLTLCEVEVFPTYISNLALNQPADQVDTVYGGNASRAVDGGNSTDWTQNSCTHTSGINDPWWRVDLGSSVPVTEVRIVNRACSDDCGLRLSAFEIRIGNSNQSGDQNNPSCGGTLSLGSGQTKSFYCVPALVGRYVFVRVPGNNKVLTLCEVQVYSTRRTSNIVKGCSSDPVGIADSSIIRDQRFSASSTHSGSNPSNGRLTGSSAWLPSSNNDASDFLQIDLGSVYFICGVATQGNPSADDWTKTYKIETSLNNVNWRNYVEDNVEKAFTGNSDRNSIVRSDLYQPVAAKFIRFYPMSFFNNKTLRVEVYGSLQGCLSSMGNERFVNRNVGATASSELDSSHEAGWSRLYGTDSWCTASVSLPQYLQFNVGRVITVSGVSTQGDSVMDKWVTSYAIRYGYDGQKWFDYSAGRALNGNRDRSSIVVNWFSSPFAAQYIRILPKTYNTGICLRVDFIVCEKFQVPFLFVDKLQDGILSASPPGSVTLHCVARFSKQRPPVYKWRRGVTDLRESSSSLTITYTSATYINSNYYCARKSLSMRDVQCNATYQCSASLVDLPLFKDDTKGNVTVILKVQGKPVVQFHSGGIQARSALVTGSYSPESDEAPIVSFTIRYQNNTFTDDITLAGGVSIKELVNLKPYTTYRASMMATSVLGTGEWSNSVSFRTRTAIPEVAPHLNNVTALTSQSLYIEWQKPSLQKVNGLLIGYKISYKEAGMAASIVSVPSSSTSYTLTNLKKWTDYVLRIKVTNGDYEGPWSAERRARTKQDAPSPPKNLQLTVQGPNGTLRPRIFVRWLKPDSANGIITSYTLVYSYDVAGHTASRQLEMNADVFSFHFSVLGGVRYTVRARAETVKPGQEATESILVPTYKPSIPPQDIRSQKIHQGSYNITWQHLSREESNGKISVYEVKISAFPRQCTRGAILGLLDNFNNVSRTKHNFVFSDVRPCTDYEIRVRAYTSAGASEFGSLPASVGTSVSVVPSGLSATSPQKTSVTLTWNEPALNSEIVEAYQIVLNGTKSYFEEFQDSRVIETYGSVLTYKVEDLSAGSNYTFSVRAKTPCGIGDLGNEVSAETIADYPRTPDASVVEKISTPSTSTPITVWGSKPYNGPISHYQVIADLVKDWTDQIPEKYTKVLQGYEKSQDQNQSFYIAAELPSTSIHPSLSFIIGDAKSYGGYENVALVKPNKYKIYIRAVTTYPKYLPGKESLVAMVTVMAEEQGTTPYTSKSIALSDKQRTKLGTSKNPISNTVLLISTIILGIALILSLGVNVYFWCIRHTTRSYKDVKVDAPQNEQDDPGLQSPPVYMELRPT